MWAEDHYTRHHFMSCNTWGHRQFTMLFSRHHTQNIDLTWVTRDWETRGGRAERKEKNDHWALALLEEALALPRHLSSVKCVGKTFTTSVALLRVSSHLQPSPHEQHVKNELGWPLPWPSTSSSLAKSREFGLQYILPASSHPGSWGVEFHLFLS